MSLLSKLGGGLSSGRDEPCSWLLRNVSRLSYQELYSHQQTCRVCKRAMETKRKMDRKSSKTEQQNAATGSMGHETGYRGGIWRFIIKLFLPISSKPRKTPLETTKNIGSDGLSLENNNENNTVLIGEIVNHTSLVPGADSKQEARIEKVIGLGQGIVHDMKMAIVSLKAGDNAAKFENAGLLCEAIGKIGGEKAFGILKEFSMITSNIDEYKYIRKGAARGLAYLSRVDARADELLSDLANTWGIGDEINEILHSIGRQPKKSWDILANSFVTTELAAKVPDYNKLAKQLIGFPPNKRHGAWVIVAEALLKMKRKEEAMRCYAEALYNNSDDTSVAWCWLNGEMGDQGVEWLPPNAPQTKKTVEALRNSIGSIINSINKSVISASSPSEKEGANMSDQEMLSILRRLCNAYAEDDPIYKELEPIAADIGKLLDKRGGIDEMRRMFNQLGNVRGSRTLEMHWGGIGEWMG
jgi:tetratricopeptide (TPR) repeat protein